MANAIWAAMRDAGWGVVYYATIEGLPIVFAERATGLSLPSGYTTELADLIIDDSGAVGQEIDRRTGLGKGLPLSFGLRDSATLRGYLVKGHTTFLTANIDGSSTSAISVSDDSAFDSSGSIYVGLERITYTSTSGTSFGGSVARGLTGYGYPHRAGTVVSSAPHRWQGREVRLYARPITPSGYLPGTAIADNAVEVWRGRIRNGPRRDGNMWSIDALALDRVLANKLPDPISGEVQHAPDPGQALVEMTNELKAWSYYLSLELFQSNGNSIGSDEAAIQPFSNLTAGAFYSARELQEEIATDFETALSGATYIMSVDFAQATPYEHPGVSGSQIYRTRLQVLFSGTTNAKRAVIRVAHTDQPLGDPFVPVDQDQSSYPFEWIETKDYTGSGTTYEIEPPHPVLGFGVFAKVGTESKADAVFAASTLRVVSDDLALALPAASGLIAPEFMLDGTLYEYDTAEQVGPAYYLSGVRKAGGTAGLDALAIPNGATVEIGVYAFGSSMAQLMRRVLQSTGDTSLRSSFDVLPSGAGYGLPTNAIDTDAFSDFSLPVEAKATNPIGRSFADLFCGWLALNDRAVVLRDVDGDQKLSIVSTANAWPDGEITDSDLMTREGFGLELDEPEPTPTEIRVSYRTQAGGQGKVTLRDTDRALYQRPEVAEYEAQGVAREAVVAQVVQQTGPAVFARGLGQMVARLHVGPWHEAQPGDTIGLTIEHPDVYDVAGADLTYNDTALVLGRKMRLADSRVTLTVLLQGYHRTAALCPAMAVSAKAGGTGAVPSTVDVPQRYVQICERALAEAGGSSFVVLHYVRGDSADETTGNELTIDDVTDTGSVCRLSVASGSNTVTIATDGTSILTWPDEGGNGDAWQDAWFIHVDDGEDWG